MEKRKSLVFKLPSDRHLLVRMAELVTLSRKVLVPPHPPSPFWVDAPQLRWVLAAKAHRGSSPGNHPPSLPVPSLDGCSQ